MQLSFLKTWRKTELSQACCTMRWVRELLQSLRVLLWGKARALRNMRASSHAWHFVECFPRLSEGALCPSQLPSSTAWTRSCEQSDRVAAPFPPAHVVFLFLLLSSSQATEAAASLSSMFTESKKSPGEMANTLSCLSLSGTSSIYSLERLWKLPLHSQSLQTRVLVRLGP